MDEFYDDADEELVDPDAHAEPRPVDRWRRTTASGAVTAALVFGFKEVFDPERADNTVGIEQEAPERPVDPDKPELRFDPLNSQGTVVVVRPRRDDDGAGGKGQAGAP